MGSGFSPNQHLIRDSWSFLLDKGPTILRKSRVLPGVQSLRPFRAYRHTQISASNAAGGDDVHISLREALLRSLRSDGAEGFQTMQQGSADWLAARKLRLTASNFGTAVGHNPWKSPDDLIEDMLFGKFKGNSATRWGNDKEALARNLYVLRKRIALSQERNESSATIDFHVRESGLHVWDQQPWLAASPDGIVHENGQVGLLEIKCPFSLKLYAQIPQYYFDQIQGIMGILGISWCDFVVWTPTTMSVERVPFDSKYWEEILLPELSNFYMNHFVPRYVTHEIERQSVPVSDLDQDRIDSVFSSWTDLVPIASIGANIETKTKDSEWLKNVERLSTETFADFDFFLNGALQLDERLAKNTLRLDFVGSSYDSIFLAVSSQLERQGLLTVPSGGKASPAGDSRTDRLREVAWRIRVETVAYIAAHIGDFELATGRSSRVILDRLRSLSVGQGAPGPIELAAVAQIYAVHIVCLVVSSQQVEERHFYPSLQSGPSSLGAARGRIVLASAGGVYWSTAPLAAASRGSGKSKHGSNQKDSADCGPSVSADGITSTKPSASMPPLQTVSKQSSQEAGGTEVVGGGEMKGVGRSGGQGTEMNGSAGGIALAEAAGAYQKGGAEAGGPAGAEFGSRFSPLFQQCVVDVTAKMLRGGAGELDAVRQAFAICRRSVKERRYGAHAVRRNGEVIADVSQTAAAYEALLVRYQVALVKHLGSGP